MTSGPSPLTLLALVAMLTAGVKGVEFNRVEEEDRNGVVTVLGVPEAEALMTQWALAFDRVASADSSRSLHIQYSKHPGSYSRDVMVGGAKGSHVAIVDAGSVPTNEELQVDPALVVFPLAACGVALVYNLPDLPTLHIGRKQLVAIFSGEITHWRDQRLAVDNPRVTLPDDKIQIVTLKRESTATFILTSTLTHMDAAWAAAYGSFSVGINAGVGTSNWPTKLVSYHARDYEDAKRRILTTPHSLGYLPLAEAVAASMQMATIENSARVLAFPSVQHVAQALSAFSDRLGPLQASTPHLELLADAHGALAWPLSGTLYLVARRAEGPGGSGHCASAYRLTSFLHWALTQTQPRYLALDQHLAPMPRQVVDGTAGKGKGKGERGRGVLEALNTLRCSSAPPPAWAALRSDTSPPALWRTPVMIAGLVLALVLFLAALYWSRRLATTLRQQDARNKDPWIFSSDLHLLLRQDSSCVVATRGRPSQQFVEWNSDGAWSKGDNCGGDCRHFRLKALHMARLTDKLVSLRPLHISQQQLNVQLKRHVQQVRTKLSHENVMSLIGLTSLDNQVMAVEEFLPKGSLCHLLTDRRLLPHTRLKLTLAVQVLSGLHFLHNSGLMHGRLRASSCYLGPGCVAKVGDWFTGRLEGGGDGFLPSHAREPRGVTTEVVAPVNAQRANQKTAADAKQGDTVAMATFQTQSRLSVSVPEALLCDRDVKQEENDVSVARSRSFPAWGVPPHGRTASGEDESEGGGEKSQWQIHVRQESHRSASHTESRPGEEKDGKVTSEKGGWFTMTWSDNDAFPGRSEGSPSRASDWPSTNNTPREVRGQEATDPTGLRSPRRHDVTGNALHKAEGLMDLLQGGKLLEGRVARASRDRTRRPRDLNRSSDEDTMDSSPDSPPSPPAWGRSPWARWGEGGVGGDPLSHSHSLTPRDVKCELTSSDSDSPLGERRGKLGAGKEDRKALVARRQGGDHAEGALARRRKKVTGIVTKMGVMMSLKGKENGDQEVAADNEKASMPRCDVNQNAADGMGVAMATATPLRRRLNNSSTDAELFWTAPEVLTGKSPVTKASDVYSWAILVAEILTQVPPYWELTGALTATQVLEGVVWTELRPQLPRDTPPPVRHLLDRAWLQEAELRPVTSALMSMAQSAFPAPVTSVERALDVIDVCLGCHPEVKPYVQEALPCSRQAAGASGAVELPETTSSSFSSPSSPPRPQFPNPQLLLPGVAVGTAHECESVAVVSVAIVGVGALVARSSPSNVVDAISSLFAMASTHLGGPGMLLCETWADCFMAVAGASNPSTRNPQALASAIPRGTPSSLSAPATAAIAALNFLSAARRFVSQNRFLGLTIHSGMAIGCALVGVLKFGQPKVVVVGDAVSTATGLANAAPDMAIHVTSGVHRALTSEPNMAFVFAKSPHFSDLSEADSAESVKGERHVTTWLLLGRKEVEKHSPPTLPVSPPPSV